MKNLLLNKSGKTKSGTEKKPNAENLGKTKSDIFFHTEYKIIGIQTRLKYHLNTDHFFTLAL